MKNLDQKKPVSNPSAFPTRMIGEDPARPDLSGMTLRDYFAAKAMQKIKRENPTNTAILAYEIADAMLKQRTK